MFKKIFRKIRKVLKPVGKAFKKVMKPFAKIQQKLGPVGTMALMFIAPYALPAIWGAFGAWVGAGGAAAGASFKAMSAGMQTMMTKIYTFGTQIGKAYSTVTGFIKDTVGKIASNTIGKIPVGTDQTVGSLWKNFTDNLSMSMETRNLKFGKNIVDANGNFSKGFTQANKLAADNLNIANKIQIDKSIAFGETVTEVQAAEVFGKGFDVTRDKLSTTPLLDFDVAGSKPRTTSLLDLDTNQLQLGERTRKVIVDLKHSYKNANISSSNTIAVGDSLPVEKLDFLEPITMDVPESVIKANPQLEFNNKKLLEYTTDVNSFAEPYLGENAIPFDRAKLTRKKLVSDTKKALEGIDILTGVAAEPEADPFQVSQNMQLAQSIAPIGYAGLQDFSSDFSNLSSTYSAAGYGPEANFLTPQSQYEAGAYGGAGFMNQVSSRFLQPTIGMPRLA